jgi:N-acetylglutamate synthase-like GNAT family acetyltransferase
MSTFALPPNVTIRTALQPGDIGMLVYLHGTLYAQMRGWDHTFEAYVAVPLSEFVKTPSARQRIWIVEKDGLAAGSIAIVAASPTSAQLRWFLLHPELRDFGLGKHLVKEALDFCRASGYETVFLYTVNDLDAAASLYKAAGFKLTEESPAERWGGKMMEQRYDLRLSPEAERGA